MVLCACFVLVYLDFFRSVGYDWAGANKLYLVGQNESLKPAFY